MAERKKRDRVSRPHLIKKEGGSCFEGPTPVLVKQEAMDIIREDQGLEVSFPPYL